MTNPVCVNEVDYEKAAIIDYLRKNNMCPNGKKVDTTTPGFPFESSRIVKNLCKKAIKQNFKASQLSSVASSSDLSSDQQP